ncbi:UDP-N-acetylmuramoyl-L-alanyl-D-glutamate--2,6-diaminopimelate ligase [Candidatus Omnitrophota bacterium]
MRLKKLLLGLKHKRSANLTDYQIKGITCNSQQVQPGYLFVAIKGACVDGHRFLDQAVARGAAAVILENDLPLKNNVMKIVVPDSKAALAHAAAHFYAYPAKKLKVIGVTGTNGKTTVSYLLEKILNSAGFGCGLIGTVNYRLGKKIQPALNTTPSAELLQSWLQEFVSAKSKYAIIEVSSHALIQKRVGGIDFSQAIFTNLSREHLDYHKNLASYFSSKAILFEKLKPQSWAIINRDDLFGRKLLKMTKAKTLTYAIEQTAQIQAKDLRLGNQGTSFKVVTATGTIPVETALIGRHNVYNILAAFGAAFVEKIEFGQIAQGVRALKLVPGRLERVNCGQDFLTFIDYAHTEDALRKILQAVRKISNRRIILVFGCGGDRDKSKRPRMGKVATKFSDFAVITSDNPRSEDPQEITTDILRGVSNKTNNYKIVLDRFQAIATGLSLARKDDIVLICGKGHERSQIFADRAVHFSDRQAVRKILKCLPSQKY